MRNLFIFISLISLALLANSNDNLNARDFALKKCLFYNYNKLDNSISISNDASNLSTQYKPEDWNNIIKFVKDNTSDYYKEIIIMHFEERPDEAMNIVFSKCMGFYHSKKMNEFIRKNKY